MEIFLSFIIKIGFIISTMILSGILTVKIRKKLINEVVQGIYFSLIILIDMLNPFIASNQTNFDIREIILNVVGIFYGPVAIIITGFFTIILRYFRGTQGMEFAILGIILILILTIYIYKISFPKNTSTKNIIILSSLTSFISFISIVIVKENRTNIEALIASLIILLSFPLATLFCSRIIKGILLNDEYLKALKNKKEMLDNVFLNANNAALIAENRKIVQANKKCISLLRYNEFNELYNKDVLEILSLEDNNNFLENIKRAEKGQNIEKEEIIILCKNGEKLICEINLNKIIHDNKDYIYVTFSDIRERKEKETKVIEKSRTDALTGAYNREYLNYIISELSSKDYPLGFISADLNGLKVINDFAGHKFGDELLIKIVKILKTACKDKGEVIRIGGDEFLIFVKNTSEPELKKIIKDIVFLSSEDKDGLSISMGMALSKEINEDIKSLIDKSDLEMYKVKAKQSLDFKINYFQKVYKENLETNSFKIKYTDVIQELCINLADLMNLNDISKKHILLMTKYYDIGKVANFDRALSINNYERTYNLIRQIPNIAEIAIYILYIGENVDGSGKNKLNIDEIPIESRILRTVNDYYLNYEDIYTNSLKNKDFYNKNIKIEALKTLKSKKDVFYDKSLLYALEEIIEFIKEPSLINSKLI